MAKAVLSAVQHSPACKYSLFLDLKLFRAVVSSKINAF